MKNRYDGWVIKNPDGTLWMQTWWESPDGVNGAWQFLHWSEDKKVSALKKAGFSVIPIEVKVKEINSSTGDKEK
jgi:hypothetical protein